MVVVMKERATEEQIERVIAHLVEMGHRRAPVDRRVARRPRRGRRAARSIRG